MMIKEDVQHENLKNDVHIQNLASGFRLEHLRATGKLGYSGSCILKTNHFSLNILYPS